MAEQITERYLKDELLNQANALAESRKPDTQALGLIVNLLGSLLSLWTGQEVRLQLTAEGETEGLDMTKNINGGR